MIYSLEKMEDVKGAQERYKTLATADSAGSLVVLLKPLVQTYTGGLLKVQIVATDEDEVRTVVGVFIFNAGGMQ